MLQLIAGAIDDRSARGIAAAVSRLVSTGELPAGARLPTVRAVARELGISPTTVSEAWRSLAGAGAIETRGRSGSFVLAPTRPRQRLRYSQLTASPAVLPHDLSTGIPDYDLLPDLSAALRRVGHTTRLTTSYLDEPVLPALEAVLRERWPYPPAELTVVDGAMDALDRITTAVVRFGDHVLVEDPTFPPMLDLLEAVGAIPVGVAMDDHGLRPDALEAALDHTPAALYLQPRAHNPTGVSTTAARAKQLAEVLTRHPHAASVIVVEDDHAGDIATAPPVSIGDHLPEHTLHVRSFSKSHGPDLRLAAIGGPTRLITRIADRRLLGPGWSSRLLQAVLLDLLTHEEAVSQVTAARQEYADRRQALLTALTERGVRATGADGINLWLEVGDQHVAMLTLAGHGIAVAPGAPFTLGAPETDHVRVTAGLVRDGVDQLADALAEAADSLHRATGRRATTLRPGIR